MKKTIVYFIIAVIEMSCIKNVSNPAAKKSNTEVMRKRSDPTEDAKHY